MEEKGSFLNEPEAQECFLQLGNGLVVLFWPFNKPHVEMAGFGTRGRSAVSASSVLREQGGPYTSQVFQPIYVTLFLRIC